MRISTGSWGAVVFALRFALKRVHTRSVVLPTFVLSLTRPHAAGRLQGAATLSGFSDNEAMLDRALSAMSQGTSTGEAVLQARQALGPSFQAVITNWAVLGDPSLHLSP